MARTKWLLASVGFGLCLCLALWLANRPTGPEYAGRPLSAWLEAYKFDPSRANAAEVANADFAVRALGTNAIPYLLDLLHKKNSKPYAFVCRGLGNHLNPFSFPEPLAPAELGYYHASEAFRALGPSVGKAAIPELIEILLSEDPADRSGDFASCCLTSFGAESVPALRQVLKVRSDVAQQRALVTLRRIGAAAEPAVPDIVKLLDAPDPQTRRDAALALRSIGANAPVAAPALAKKLDDPDFMVRANAFGALLKYGTQARSAVPYLLATLDAQSQSKGAYPLPIATLLCKIAPDEAEKHATQMFSNLLKGKNGVSYETFVSLLADVPSTAKVVTPLLVNYLNEDRTGERITPTLHILCTLGPDAKEALPALQTLAKNLQDASKPETSEPVMKRARALAAWKNDPHAQTQLAAALYAIAPEETLAQVEALLVAQFDRDPTDLKNVVPEFDHWLEGRSAPVYMAMLDNSEHRVKRYGLRALGWLGSSAAEALPKIRRFTPETPDAPLQEQELRILALSAEESILHLPPTSAH